MTLKLPRLTARTPVTGDIASTTFVRFWGDAMSALEQTFNGNTSVTDQVNVLTQGVATRDADNEFTGGNSFDQVVECAAGVSVNLTQVLGAQDTGWTAGTGTPSKGAFASYAGHTCSAGYVQAEAQATDDAVKAVSQRLLALEQAMMLAHGLIGP